VAASLVTVTSGWSTEPPLRLGANGDAILTEEHSVQLFAPGARKGVPLSRAGDLRQHRVLDRGRRAWAGGR
jgi:hypothetical protein